MLTAEVRKWIKKVEENCCPYEDAMKEFAELSKFLTLEEIKIIKSKLEEYCTKSNF